MARPDFEAKKFGPIYYKLGLVADPAPEILLDKDQLARIKIQILEHEILELKNQINLAETYMGMLRETYKIG